MIVQICVGSSCHLKGSEEIVRLFEAAVSEHQLGDEVALAGSFCLGRCGRSGVTVQIDDEVHVGVTPESFREFFKKNVLDVIQGERT